MNEKTLDNLTYGEIKELLDLFQKTTQEKDSCIFKSAIGKYCIVRSINEGVNAGVVEAADETGVVLSEARRLYFHKPKDPHTSWYEGVAETGLHEVSKISGVCRQKYIVEDYSLTVCTKEAEQNIRNHEATKS